MNSEIKKNLTSGWKWVGLPIDHLIKAELKEWDKAAEKDCYSPKVETKNEVRQQQIESRQSKPTIPFSLNPTAFFEGISFVITDPCLPDNPIVFASSSFCSLTG